MKNQPLSLRQFEEMLWQQTLEQVPRLDFPKTKSRRKFTSCLKPVREFPQSVPA